MKGTLPMRSPSGTATSVASAKPALMRHEVGPTLWMRAPPVMLSTHDCAMVLTFGMEAGSIHLCPDAYSHSRRITTIRRKPGQRLVTGIAGECLGEVEAQRCSTMGVPPPPRGGEQGVRGVSGCGLCGGAGRRRGARAGGGGGGGRGADAPR